MKRPPQTLAVRAVNQYRRRDAIGYLGVRLYLDNACATSDQWAESVATRIALHDPSPHYHVSLHYKERDDETGRIRYRRLCLPSPNEIIAETALLSACANSGDSFSNPDSVYSYELAQAGERRGVFLPYFVGFRRRHADIAAAARRHGDGLVVYADIRRFYPSIESATARGAWESTSRQADLPKWATNLGNKFIDNYKCFCNGDEKGVLTGPMFSHLLANLVLRDIDEQMSRLLPGGYFRYVDDFALVGPQNVVRSAEAELKTRLSSLGLETNETKRLEVPAAQWLIGEGDFSDEPHVVSWKTFVGRMKQLLVARPALTATITEGFALEGFRIAPLNYADVVGERGYLSRLLDLLPSSWFPQQLRRTTPEELLRQGKTLRSRYEREFWESINNADQLQGYQRKRRVHNLRRLASRLIYLASPDTLPAIASALAGVSEMNLHSAVFDALATRDVSRIVHYGANAAHCVTQGLLWPRADVTCQSGDWPDAARQARAILLAHGVPLKESPRAIRSDMEQFCEWEDGSPNLRGKPDTYFGELAHLHGMGGRRHQDLLLRAFDADEDMIVDIEDIMGQSYQ